ncbi:hypothetical protein DWW79_04260 [Alistipes sp. AF17-16]|uniref:clostripain-related cysteine peptidase n=1 Tax=Alistipes TaxID=239759 RepID=UPI000E4AD1A1|nr:MULTISPECIES: clostripain-related cysteine peptidase [Alistipes]RHR64333.1 hypothetical protein DWW79_04260 [Alistipes sp. AF17-16]
MKRPCTRYLTLAALCAAALASSWLVSCESGCTGDPDGPAPAGRTVLAYMASDNDLNAETSDKIAALCRGRAAARAGELLIYADTPQGARLLRALPDGTQQTVAEYGAENSASPAVLGRTLRETMNAFPAPGYGLVFFSHGSGWLPQGALQSPGRTSSGTIGSRSMGRDESDEQTPHAEMELEEFASAIADGSLDFIVFEACLMAGAEVAYALRDKAECMLASSAEILSPGFTLVYGSALKYLLDASAPAPECLAAFGSAYMGHVATQTGVYRSATLSVVDLHEMEPLAARMAELPTLSIRESDITDDLQRFDRPGSYGDNPAVARYFDLEECVQRLAGETGALQEQLRRTVVWKDQTERFMVGDDGNYGRYNGFDITAHSGLTVYLPRAELAALNEAYRRTAWYRAVSGQ